MKVIVSYFLGFITGIATFVVPLLIILLYTDILTKNTTIKHTGDVLYYRLINDVNDFKYTSSIKPGPISKVLRSLFSVNKEENINFSVDTITSAVQQLQKLQNTLNISKDDTNNDVNKSIPEDGFVNRTLNSLVTEYLHQVQSKLWITEQDATDVTKTINVDTDIDTNKISSTLSSENVTESGEDTTSTVASGEDVPDTTVSRNQDNNGTSETVEKDQSQDKQTAYIETRGETLLWFNIISCYIATFIHKLSNSLDQEYMQPSDNHKNNTSIRRNNKTVSKHSTVIKKLLNNILQNVDRPQFLGVTKFEYLEVGYVFPLIHDITVVNSNLNEPIILDIDFSVVTDSVIEISTSLVVTVKQVQLIDLPLQLALSNVLLSGHMRIAIDLNTEKPSVAFCFKETPNVQFDIATAFGNRIQLINIPLLYGLLHKFLLNAINNKLVADNVININILTSYLATLRSKAQLLDEVVQQKSNT